MNSVSTAFRCRSLITIRWSRHSARKVLNNALGDRVRARNSDRSPDASNVELGQTSVHVASVDGVAIVDEVTGMPSPGCGLQHLPTDPRRRWARCDVEMDQLPTSMPNEEEDVEGLETDRLNHEEVGRRSPAAG